MSKSLTVAPLIGIQAVEVTGVVNGWRLPVLRSRNSAKLDGWPDDAYRSGIYAMQRFARTLRRDPDAGRNAVTEPWSNG